MIQDLSEKIWSNPEFHKAYSKIEQAWFNQELRLDPKASPDEKMAIKAMNAAAVLACSIKAEQRAAAYKIATCAYDLFQTSDFPFDAALRVVLTRLGNFPALATKSDVKGSQHSMPWMIVSEELFLVDQQTVTINAAEVALTSFQHTLWTDLVSRASIAFSAPTSAGKSFVLENYLSSISTREGLSTIYIVPTRALISQVANDLNQALKSFAESIPQIITVPPDKEKSLPKKAIYIMTQERAQLALFSHADFSPHIIVVDEAQSIADGSRGVLLQTVIDDLLHRRPNAQILFASPTIRNLGLFGKLFGLPQMLERVSREPTVAQNFLIVEVRSSSNGLVRIKTAPSDDLPPTELANITIGQTLASRIDRLVQIPAFLGAGQANLIYTNVADEAEKVAIQLADKFFDRATTEAQENIAKLAEEAVHSDYVLANCVRKGIGFHYGNIPAILRLAIEEWPAPGSEDTELGVLMEPEVGHGETEVYTRVQA